MKFPRVKTSTSLAFEIYHQRPYFTRADIKTLFNCSDATVSKIVKIIHEEMEKKGVEVYVINHSYLDKKITFELAGLDINEINKSYKYLASMERHKKSGVIQA